MKQVCKFCPASDTERVVPALSPDVSEMMATGVVPSSSDSTPYTKETQISEVGHYLKDKIQTAIAAINLQRSMSAQIKSNSNGNGQPAPQAE